NDETYCELRYQGQIYDQETGFYYNRHRYFDPELGQYISSDPIGFAGGLRPQGYVHNPLEWVDPLGLMVVTGTTKNGMSRVSNEWRNKYGPSVMREHHLIPQAMMNDESFMRQMKQAGISNPEDYIHREISIIPNAQHIDVHDAGWNSDFKQWYAENPDFSQKDLQKNISEMMTKHKIPRASRNYAKRYKSCGGKR
ncbi:RHS repeat-associated core domain-containing protein, partial [Aeromonas hydrophila]